MQSSSAQAARVGKAAEELEDEDDVDRQFYTGESEDTSLAVDSTSVMFPERMGRNDARQSSRKGLGSQGELSRDQDEWETALMSRTGAASLSDNSRRDDSANKTRIIVKASRPTFQSGKGSFFGQTTNIVDVVKDRSSDLAKQAERGSEVLKKWKDDQQRNKMRQKYWELGGTEMGKMIGEKSEAKFMGQDDENDEEASTIAASVSSSDRPEAHSAAPLVNQDLPIMRVLPDLLRAVRENQIVVVVGETGSGKTTRLPISLLKDGAYTGIVACTQPRRVAAMSVAKRVAEESGRPVGSLVGYSIRFEDCTSKETRVKYMTDGILLRESLNDPDLDKYSVVVMDEAHERSLNTDVLFGITKRVLRNRRDFRLVVTSATLDAERFASFFGGASIFRIPGRTFKVESYFAKTPMVDYVDAAVKQVLQIHLTLPPGDILVFMTGQEDITCTCELVAERLGQILHLNDSDEASQLEQKKKLAKSKLLVLPMYSTLPTDLQSKIFDPALPGQRKCVVSTNIAETSLTVDGIRYVVDTGLTKMKVFNPKIGMDSLRLVPVSQAAANQRAGRAGRTSEGYCYRLYTEYQFKEEMLQMAVPEIQRTNLGAVILLLKSLGVNRAQDFDFMDPPPTENLVDSLNQLWVLGAVDSDGNLTPLGRRMVDFPLDPALSKMLIFADQEKCTSEIVTLVSMLNVPDVFFRPPDRAEEADQARERFVVPESDHLTLVNVYNQWLRNKKASAWCSQHFLHGKALRRAQDIREQLVEVMNKSGIREVEAGPTRWDSVRRAVCSAYFANSAVLKGVAQYVNLLNGIPCFVHPSSGLFGLGYTPDYVVYHELVITSKEWMRHVTAVDAEWLAELGPLFFAIAGSTTTAQATSSAPVPPPSAAAATAATASAVKRPNPSLSSEDGAKPSLSAIQAARDKRSKMTKRGRGFDFTSE